MFVNSFDEKNQKIFYKYNFKGKRGEKKRLQVDKKEKNAYNIYNEKVKRKKKKMDRADGRQR